MSTFLIDHSIQSYDRQSENSVPSRIKEWLTVIIPTDN